jgi:hypothetical protein
LIILLALTKATVKTVKCSSNGNIQHCVHNDFLFL